jgi:hypothetical protein
VAAAASRSTAGSAVTIPPEKNIPSRVLSRCGSRDLYEDLNSRWAGSWLSDRSESAGLKKGYVTTGESAPPHPPGAPDRESPPPISIQYVHCGARCGWQLRPTVLAITLCALASKTGGTSPG